MKRKKKHKIEIILTLKFEAVAVLEDCKTWGWEYLYKTKVLNINI